MARQLDLVLINPGSRTQVYQSLGSRLTAIEPPVWAGLMASFCQKQGLAVDIIDAEAEELIAEEVADRIDDLNPVLAVVVVYGHQPSASTQMMTASSMVCCSIKQRSADMPVLLVGGHVAALPFRTLAEESADYVASGEGLNTMVRLVEELKNSTPKLDKVPGLWYRQNGRIQNNPDTPLVMDLDNTMPGVAWNLLPMPKYRAHNWHCLGGQDRQPYAALYTSLGCPYHCSFCCIQAPYRSGEKAGGKKQSTNSYRFWSPDAVISQIDVLVNQYGVRNIKIADEMFVLNRHHVIGICDRIIERGYDLNIWAYTRIDTIRDGMLEKLKQAGFNWLAVGIEAGSNRVRANVDKGFDQEKVFQVIQQIRNAGINVIGNYIFGLPEDDHGTMRDTMQMALDLNCEFANFYSAMAYPGSSLYDVAVRQGVPLPSDWTGYSQHSRDCLPLPTYYLTAREVLEVRDAAFLTYYSSPTYLRMVDQKFGPETVKQIQQMTQFRLERDLLTGKIPDTGALIARTETESRVPEMPLIQLGRNKP